MKNYLRIVLMQVILIHIFFLFPVSVLHAKFSPLTRPNISYDSTVEDDEYISYDSSIEDDYYSKGSEDVIQEQDIDKQYLVEHQGGDVTNYPVRKINSDYITSHGEYVDIHVVDIPVVDLLNEVAARLDKELLISSNFPQRVSVNLNNATMDGLLDLLAKDIGINWHFDNNVYIIAPENQSFTPYFFPVRYANLDKLKRSLDALGLGGRIVLNDYPRGLLVNGAGNDIRNISRLIEQLDVLEPSIQVEFVVLEINKSDETKFGLNWGDVSANYRYSNLRRFGSVPYSQTTDIARTLTSSITSILSSGKSSGRILAQPYIVTANAESARLSTGDEIPIFTKDYHGNPAVSYKRVGIELNVTPRIVNMEENILSISSRTTVNIISGQQTQQGLTAPQISSREAEDTLDVRSGEVVVIGGLIKEEDIRTNSGIPLLKDIPLLGKLFQTTSHSKTYTDILIFIKPTIIREPIVSGINAKEFNPWGYKQENTP